MNPVTTNLATAAPARTGSASRDSISAAGDFESFLRLLTAQLRHQDPLSPLDSTEFVAQLASFSTVEQLVKANERLDAIAGASSSLARFADWIGADAGVAGAPARFDGAPVELRVPSNRLADRVEISVSNADGVEVARFVAANSDGGQYWDGATPTGAAPPGYYTFTAHYFANAAPIAQAAATTFDRVTELSVVEGGVALRLASGAIVSPGDVTSLRAAR